ncbi:transporter family-2 protein [Aeromicrobium sp. SORGH_AS981]|uniref:DMT family transporter n=1 Tax=Aeromicrobium sp. SORGH_AS_0981 TaxID=3041802 RepID=UPI002856F514|nr:DMT family transporter [Aeromicrobium sp. SORGH_AS_0981]MDR6119519.1 transporter family-2 protein [Aeromicrobium sp. SORGH_AS_0981]
MEHPVLRAATVPLMLLVGALITLQSRVNASLAGQLGDGLRAGALAAVVSFGSGLLLLSAVVLSHPRRRAGLRRVLDALRDPDAGGDRPRLRPVHLLGGLGGAFFVASQGIAVGVIGVALFIVAFTAGQSVASLVVDHVGLGPGGHEPVSRPRAVAALFAVAAVTVKVLGDLDGSHLGLSLLLASLALVAGCLQAVQQAFNGKISAVGGPLVTTWNNFLVGTSALLVLLVVSLLAPGHVDGFPSQWWYYVGGVLGIGFIAISAVAVQIHGVLVLGLCSIAGQVVAAEVIEVLDPSVDVSWLGLLGGLLAVVGVVVALATRRRP